MVQILPKVPGFGERFGAAIGGGLGQGFQQGMTKAQEFAQQMKLQEAKQNKEKEANKFQALHGVDESIDEMLDLADSAGIGLTGNLNLTGDAYYNRGRMQTLKGELLNYYKSLFPRGLTQQEFKKLEKDYLPSNRDTVKGMKGKLDAFKDLIHRKLKEEGSDKGQKKGKVAFDLNNKEHKSKRDQLLKKFNNDREKVQEILDREFE